MKKIGIMSMQRITNYGSFLQAYGLKNTLEELGYDVQFVDYEFEKSIVTDAGDKKNKITFYNVLNKIRIKYEWKKFQKKYCKYLSDYLNISAIKNIRPNNIEKLVIGSDEVFNCMQSYPVGYSKELFGKNYEKIDVISYAASFGFTNFELLEKYKIKDELADMLNNFKAISVRDENSFDIIKTITEQQPYMHLDPVLISNYEYCNYVNLKNYIIVYTYPGRLSSEEEQYIKKFAKENHKKIVSIGFYQTIADIHLCPSPLEVFSYFKNADYVITDTFHGTIFSIKTKAKFCTIIRNSNKNKLLYLLKKLNCEDRQVNSLNDIDRLFRKNINYDETCKIILEERNKSIEYLKKYL